MVDNRRKFDCETKSFIQLWKGFVAFTLLLILIPHYNHANTRIDTVKTSVEVNVYVDGGALIYNFDEFSNAKVVAILPKSDKKLETKSDKKLVGQFPDSGQKNIKKKSVATTENRIKKCSFSFVNLSEEKLSKLFLTHSLLSMPVSCSSGIKGILQKYDSPFLPLFYLYLNSYFNSNHSSFNKYVLASQSIRPPPGVV